jgi:hypothetical protein
MADLTELSSWELLEIYIRKFNDETISNEEMKIWLDDEWLPAVRDILERKRKVDNA